jgi:hypothetical protein
VNTKHLPVNRPTFKPKPFSRRIAVYENFSTSRTASDHPYHAGLPPLHENRDHLRPSQSVTVSCGQSHRSFTPLPIPHLPPSLRFCLILDFQLPIVPPWPSTAVTASVSHEHKLFRFSHDATILQRLDSRRRVFVLAWRLFGPSRCFTNARVDLADQWLGAPGRLESA